jgi:hypothetical protein
MSNLSLFPPSHLTFVILQMDMVPISSSQATTGPLAKSIRDNAARSPSWRVPPNRTTASPRPPTASAGRTTPSSSLPRASKVSAKEHRGRVRRRIGRKSNAQRVPYSRSSSFNAWLAHSSWDACGAHGVWMYLHERADRLSLARGRSSPHLPL